MLSNDSRVGCRQHQAAAPDIVMPALSIALQHPALSTHQHVICAAARACKAWREAVRHCSACNTAITLNPEAPLPQLCSFSQWLTKHAPLVKSITATFDNESFESGMSRMPELQWQQHLAVAQQLLQLALQLASSAERPEAATASQQQQQQQQACLRLSSFSSNCLVTLDMLAALPAHSLTHLDLNLMHSPAMDGSALSAALARLSSLQQLSLSNDSRHRGIARQLQRLTLAIYCEEPQQLLRLAQLPAVQHLALEYGAPHAAAATAAAWPQLPQRGLTLRIRDSSVTWLEIEAMLVGIAGSSGLTQLHLQVPEPSHDDEEDDDGAAVVVLPMTVCARLTGLSGLKDLAIKCNIVEREWLVAGDVLALTALTGLTRLALSGLEFALGDLEATALACSLTQLRSLNLSDNQLGDMVCLAAIARLTQLTRLVLWDNIECNRITQRGLMMLTTLTRLQKLGMYQRNDVCTEEFWDVLHGQQP
uniref:RNI-like protein n=1 Tax=Tetradesmus obliquus TaxID=3088 RepID=A0A383W7L2_TETOB|eukprot:jgi/Sobl393_1/15832/SZX73635.1